MGDIYLDRVWSKLVGAIVVTTRRKQRPQCVSGRRIVQVIVVRARPTVEIVTSRLVIRRLT